MIYSLIIFTGSMLGRLIALFDKKTARFFSLRKGEMERIEEHFGQVNKKSVIWFHAASAGEFEQAKPIIEKIREEGHKCYIISSFFSSSGYDAGIKYDKVDFCFNFPLDYKRDIKRLLDCINPGLIVYCKYDVWKNLTEAAYARGVKILLLSGTLPKKSNRHKWPYRFFFRKIYSLLDRIYAISEYDYKRFKKMLGPEITNLINIGDTRFDRVKTVINNIQPEFKSIINKEQGVKYLVAGSTYKKSEKKLIKTVKGLIHLGEKIRLIIVPHEIDANNIERLKALIKSRGFIPKSYSDASLPLSIGENEICIIDAYGILAYLYNESDIVFVGGSYKGSIHSVLEPAIFGNPILTGPYIANSYEAIALKKIGGLKICKNHDTLSLEIIKLIHDKEYRIEVCSKVKDYFDKNSDVTASVFNDLSCYL